MRSVARKLIRGGRRLRGAASLRFGRIASSRPLSYASGFDRGTPIDRHYIEQFLVDRSNDIHGRVLEAGEAYYSRRFGADGITAQDILDVDNSNAAATIVGDLGVPGVLPPETFDCIILTQTLQYVFDLPAAIKQIRTALRPGGVLLLTVPGLAPISLDDWRDRFYWRFTEHSLERLLAIAFEPASVEVSAFGNLYAATAFLHGASVEETNRKKLETVMPEYAIVIAARAVA